MAIQHHAPVVPGIDDPDLDDDTSDPLASVATFTSDEVRTVDPAATLAEAAGLMATSDLGLLVVGTTSRVEGVISERDIVRAVAAGHDVHAMTVRELETTDVVSCDHDANAADVAEIMLEHYFRHVLVKERGHLVGVVSARDLLGAFVNSR